MTYMNRQWVLASRPVGMPTQENFRLVTAPVPAPQPGQVVVKMNYISVDPYTRARMRNVKSYVEPLQINEVIEAAVVGQVVQSKNHLFSVGDFVTGHLGWQEYAVSNGDDLRKLDPEPQLLSASLGTLGMPGLT